MTTINICVENNEKVALEEKNAKKVLHDRMLRFLIEAPIDPFYSDSNIVQLKKADKQVKNGKVVVRSMEELEAMADE